jgi:restriction endonuclease Mrr
MVDYQRVAEKIAAAKYAHQQSTKMIVERLRQHIPEETMNQIINESMAELACQVRAMSPDQVNNIIAREIFATLQPDYDGTLN